LSERGTVESTNLTGSTEHGPGANGDNPVVIAYRACDDDMTVELRIGRVGT
jgi:hypothetical protein